MRKFFVSFLLFIFASIYCVVVSAEAANHYVRAGAIGTGSGSDWGNAYSSLPESLVRGDTYYIADGTYSSYSFNDNESGKTLITIRKATIADHGTNSGWMDSYGDGVAEFDPVIFTAGYYEIDGQRGGGAKSWNSGYGFRIRLTSNDSVKLLKFAAPVSNLTFRHIDFSYDYNDILKFPAGSAVASGQDAVYSLFNASNITFSYCRFNRAGRTAILSRSAWSNITIEHSFFRDCTIGTTVSQHGEVWSAHHMTGNLKDVTFRYNYVSNFTSTGGLIMSGGNGIYIYGNVFRGSYGKANGVIANWSKKPLTTNVHVYNNTFVNTDAHIGFGNTEGWKAYNNLFFRNIRTRFVNTEHDYNHSDVSLSEAHGLVKMDSPFINIENSDYHLIAATAPANTAIGAEFSKDMDGNIRGADGVWDMGAFEFAAINATRALAHPDPK